MKKNLVLSGVLVGLFLLASCGGGSKKETTYSAADVKDANEVIQYYGTSLEVLGNVAGGKNINAVLGYMEQEGKAPEVPVVAPPFVPEKDTMMLMNPGIYFNEGTRQALKENYAGLFRSRAQFYANFDQYLTYVKAKKQAEANKLLDTAYQLSTEMTEYKQNVFDILSPAVAQAERVILLGNPLEEQLVSVRKIDATMWSIVNLYTRKHVADGVRLDLKIGELSDELNAARRLPAIAGHDAEVKSFEVYLSEAEAFLRMVKQARGTGKFTNEDYEILNNAYAASMI